MSNGRTETYRERMVREEFDHLKIQAEAAIERAFERGEDHGRSEERRELIKRLREFEKDSAVAKILAELLEREVSS